MAAYYLEIYLFVTLGNVWMDSFRQPLSCKASTVKICISQFDSHKFVQLEFEHIKNDNIVSNFLFVMYVKCPLVS